MADHPSIDRGLWLAFLQRHHLGTQEQEDFLVYLTRTGALPIRSVQDLEDDYLDYLASGGPPESG